MKRYLLPLLALALIASPAAAAKPTAPGGGDSPVITIPNSVCIDPGHGGTDPGAVHHGFEEEDLNLDTSIKLKTLLEANGQTVFMTRTDDTGKSNADRYNFCNGTGAEVLISVHHNGSANYATDYSTALYSKRADVDLANSVLNGVVSQLGTDRIAISRFQSGVLLKSNMPATISEGFFVSSTEEANMLRSSYDGRLQSEAQGIYNGIQNYLNFN